MLLLWFLIGFLATLLAFISLYTLAVLLGSWIALPAKKGANDVDIYILSNGTHTDIVVPVKNEFVDWTHLFPFENTKSKRDDYSWLAIGWGDKGFYLEIPAWKDLTFGIAFRAMFGLSTAAIHATFHEQMEESPRCCKISLSMAQYRALEQFIKARLCYDTQHRSIHIATNAVYGESDAFYEAVGSYHLFYTCNTWTNEALKTCGQKAALWTVVDKGIFVHYKA